MFKIWNDNEIYKKSEKVIFHYGVIVCEKLKQET